MGRSNRGSRRTPIVYKSNNLVSNTRRDSGFLSNVYGGLSSGLGFGVAQRLIEGIFGPRHIETTYRENNIDRKNNKCDFYLNELQQCTLNNNDISICQPLAESLKLCKNNQLL